jgi:tRNA(Ile)-lysidine synthase
MEPNKKTYSATTQKALENAKKLIPEGSTIVLGLSGGPDSVFLLHLLLHLKKTGHIKEIIAAHLDHEWRTDSAKDTQFCKNFAEQHGIPFETKKLSELPIDLKWEGSKEDIARKARRFFLESMQQKYSANAIALGHHLQDQQETFFIRLLRGASLTGLCSMWPTYGPYIRPLLQTNKSDILHYLTTHGIAYLEDPSNQYETFLRNRIRTTVIPALKAADSRFDTTFMRTLGRLQETEQYLDHQAHQLLATMSRKVDEKREVSIDELLAQPPIMQSRLIILWLRQEGVQFPVTQTFIDEITRFLCSPHGGTHALHETWRMKKRRNVAWIEKNRLL